MKKFISLLACLVIILCSASSVFAVNYTTPKFYTYIDLEENGSMHIMERIEVNFSEPGHGIYRYVYKTGKCYYEKNGEVVEGEMYYSLKNFKCGEYEVYTDDVSYSDSVMVRIGSADVLLDGEQVFWLEYDVEMYADADPDLDQFYWNVVPMYWETEIGTAACKITFPSSIADYPVDVIAGPVGSGNEADCTKNWEEEDLALYAWCDRPLETGEGLTVRVVLPEGYWVNPRDDGGAGLLSAGIAGFWVFIYYLIWRVKGKDPTPIQTVEFYPPDGMTPAEVDYVMDNKESTKGIVAMPLWFASEGYIEIKEDRGDMVLKKLKNLPDNAPKYQKELFNAFFKKGNTVSISKLPSGFGDSFAESRANVEKIYLNKDGSSVLMEKERTKAGCFGCLPLGICFMMAGASVYMHTNRMFIHYIVPAVCVIMGILTLVMMFNMSKPTMRGAILRARINGFKDFIEKAELDRINKLVEDDPQYFYKILPYAYVFGLTDKWINHFEGIALEEPSWYGGSHMSVSPFMYSYEHVTAKGIESAPRSYPSSGGGSSWGGSYHSSSGGSSYSGGHSSSHGGYSGGGGGGGGGGAW